MRLESLNDRVYYAFHCLPRPLPSWKQFEVDNDLPRAVLSKLFSGERASIEHATLVKLANVLGDWIIDGKGEEPRLTGPITPRKDKYAHLDPAAWAMEYQRNPDAWLSGVREFPNEFEEAAYQLKDEVSPQAIAQVRDEAKGREFDLRPIGWARRIVHVERALAQKRLERIMASQKKDDPPSHVAKKRKVS